MELSVNLLLQWDTEAEQPIIDRILWLSPDQRKVVAIRINDDRALPRYLSDSEVRTAIQNGRCRKLEVDPFFRLQGQEQEIPPKHKHVRDRAWKWILPVLQLPPEQLFDPDYRGPMISQTANETGCSKKQLYKYLRRYWRGGQIRNALLPRFERCGAPGKHRVFHTKPGRKNASFADAGLSQGVTIGTEEREQLRKGYRLFYEASDQFSLKAAYAKTLERFFNSGFRLERGVLVATIPPPDQVPTLKQFRYWGEKGRVKAQLLVRRKGYRRFNLEHRMRIGDSTAISSGPGSVYQLDAKLAEIHLVNSLDRSRVIGQPAVYFVIDVFSRLITGFAVMFGRPCCDGALLALENAATDKVRYCAERGIEIEPEDWPSRHIPEQIMSDRRELQNERADNLVHSLGVQIMHTPPFRPDLNGIVEGSFSCLNQRLIRLLPGNAISSQSSPQAVLDVHQFEQTIIHYILGQNRTLLEKYKLTRPMLNDRVIPRPVDLWDWGTRNCSGHLRIIPESVLKSILLPTAEARITEHGIHFGRGHYVCDHVLKENWFVQARRSGAWTVQVFYDPRNTNSILLPEDTGNLIKCSLVSSDRRFAGCSFAEVEDVFSSQRSQQVKQASDDAEAEARFGAEISKITAKAREQTARSPQGMPLLKIRKTIAHCKAGTLVETVKSAKKSKRSAYESLRVLGVLRGIPRK